MQADNPIKSWAPSGRPVETPPRILVFGVGGAGGNAVDTMIDKALEGVEFIAANTDAQALSRSKAPLLLQLGVGVTEGLGAGADPELGARAAEESAERIAAILEGAHMCFVAAGMGGGTGTGAAPVIARIAREKKVLTVGVVSKPFAFEGARRMRVAEAGLVALEEHVDTLIVTPNQNLFRVANQRTTLAEAFVLADDVLHQGVKGVTDLMVRPGIVNLDFNDVRAVMDEMGKAMMGSGEAEGERRALEAAEKAIDNPLLDDVTLKGARGVLINVTGGMDLGLFELDEAVNLIRREADPDANVIFGAAFDPTMEGRVRVSVVATGIQASAKRRSEPAPRRAESRAEAPARAASDAMEPPARSPRAEEAGVWPRRRVIRETEAGSDIIRDSARTSPGEAVREINEDLAPPPEIPTLPMDEGAPNGALAARSPEHASTMGDGGDSLVRKLAGGPPPHERSESPSSPRVQTDAAPPQPERRRLGFGSGSDSLRVEIPSFLRRHGA